VDLRGLLISRLGPLFVLLVSLLAGDEMLALSVCCLRSRGSKPTSTLQLCPGASEGMVHVAIRSVPKLQRRCRKTSVEVTITLPASEGARPQSTVTGSDVSGPSLVTTTS